MEWSRKWTTAVESQALMRGLLTHMEKLARLGLVALSDEEAAARRIWQEVLSPGAKTPSLRQVDGFRNVKCWRDKEAETQQRDLTIRSLQRSLAVEEKEAENARLEAYH